MIRVYFDWVVFSNLKKDGNKSSTLKSIKDLVVNNKNSILVPYSQSHISDLKRGQDNSEKSNQLIREDLEFLRMVTQNCCFRLNSNRSNAITSEIDPLDFYDKFDSKHLLENWLFRSDGATNLGVSVPL